MNQIDKNIKNAAESFKKAIEQTGKSNVVIIFSYVGPGESNTLTFFSQAIADRFIDVIGTCEVIKYDLLNGKGE